MTAAESAAIARHNLHAATTGGRSYECAVNVTPRTLEAAKMRQGAGAKAGGHGQ